MKNPCLDLLCLADIPEVFTEIAASSSCDIHLIVILVAALRTFPFAVIVDDDLAVITAHVAVI